MTREEVIERLKLILETDIITLNGFNTPHEPLEKEIEALKMAIKALEQEPIDYKALYENYLQKSSIVIEQLRADRDRLLEDIGNIRAEIEKEADTSNRLHGISEIGLRKALKIIDKYKVESEE